MGDRKIIQCIGCLYSFVRAIESERDNRRFPNGFTKSKRDQVNISAKPKIRKYNVMVWASAFIFLIGLYIGKGSDCIGVFLAEVLSKSFRIFIAIWYLGRENLSVDVKRLARNF